MTRKDDHFPAKWVRRKGIRRSHGRDLLKRPRHEHDGCRGAVGRRSDDERDDFAVTITVYVYDSGGATTSPPEATAAEATGTVYVAQTFSLQIDDGAEAIP